MTEKDIAMQFHGIAEVVNVKLIKDKVSNKPVGYGFVEFQDFETARDVFTTLNGKKIPG
jgi:RNA recognition motif-containing protein